MNISKITPNTTTLQDVAKGFNKYLSESSHEYLNRAAILPELKGITAASPSRYTYFNPTTPIISKEQDINAGQVIDFIF